MKNFILFVLFFSNVSQAQECRHLFVGKISEQEINARIADIYDLRKTVHSSNATESRVSRSLYNSKVREIEMYIPREEVMARMKSFSQSLPAMESASLVSSHQRERLVMDFLLYENLIHEPAELSLVFAVIKERADVVKELLDRKVDINVLDKSGNAAIVYAIRTQNKEIFDLILEKNPDLSIQGSNKETSTTALREAAGSTETYFLKKILETDQGKKLVLTEAGADAVDIASYKKHLENLDLLLKNGANAFAAWMLAAELGNVESMQVIYKNGMDKNAKSQAGNTAMHRAARAKQFDVVKYLVSIGAKKNIKNNDYETPARHLHNKSPGHRDWPAYRETMKALEPDPIAATVKGYRKLKSYLQNKFSKNQNQKENL